MNPSSQAVQVKDARLACLAARSTLDNFGKFRTNRAPRSETHFKSEKKSGFSASGMGGVSYGKSSLKQNNAGQSVTQVSSTLSGGDVALTSARDTTVSASNVLADRDITVIAGRNVNILAADDSQATQSQSKSSSSGFGLAGGLSPRFTIYSKNSAKQTGETTATQAHTSLLSANGGDLTVLAGIDPTTKGTGTGNIVTQGADLLAQDKITLTANAIDLQAAANESSSHSKSQTKSVVIGAALAGGLGDQITAIGDALERARNTDNDRLQGALTLKAGYDAYKLTQGKEPPNTLPTGADPKAPASTTASATPSTVPGANSGMASSGLGISVSIGISKSKSESSTHDTQVTGTNLQAKNIEINATETDLHMAAAKLQAENIALTAKRDILLEAAANTSEIHSKNKSSSVGGGVTFAFGGQQNGLSFQLNASQSKGKANGSETSWDNTQITATESLSVKSGRDTTLIGAQLAGNSVDLDIGRDLLIQTLQDSSNYASKQSSSGFSLSLCIPPICGGTTVTGSLSASNQKIKHNYQSAVGQSGIAAGEGGFDIKVGEHTELVGAAITGSSDATKNHLTTASLTSRDLENTQKTQSSSSSFSISGGSASSALTTVAGNVAQNVMGNLSGNAALPKNGSEKGTTQSVISPAQITITGTGDATADAQSQQTADLLTSRDPKTANGSLKNTLTLQQAQLLDAKIKEQQENAEAAKLVGAVLSNVVGDVAKKQGWAEGSTEKMVLHGMVGLIEAKIGGGNAAAGALAGISQEALAPVLSQYLMDNGFDYTQIDVTDPRLTPEEKAFRTAEYVRLKNEYDSLMQLGATLAGTAVGALASGDVKGASTGANAAFVALTNNYLKHGDNKRLAEAQAKLETCSEDACRQETQAVIDELTALDAKLDAEFLAACKGASTSAACKDATIQMFDSLKTYADSAAREAASLTKTSDLTVAHKDELQSYLGLIKEANPEVRTSTESGVRLPNEYDADAYGVVDKNNKTHAYLVMKFGTEALAIADVRNEDGTYAIITDDWARNGMLNDPKYATGLMLDHLDQALKLKADVEDTAYTPVDRYTLSYAPTDGFLLDLLGAGATKFGYESESVLGLRAQMEAIEASGRNVRWVTHSRGGAEFVQAVSGSNVDFEHTSVVFHAGANNLSVTNSVMEQKNIGNVIDKDHRYRDSPFDAVPQIVGLRALTQPWNFILSAFASPLLFLGGAEHSPHTLAADRIESAPEVK